MTLQVKDITKSFGENQVLKGINLEVSSGKTLGVLGRNGAGKTTLIRIVMQVFRADSGQVLLNGKPWKREELRVGYLPEERGMYPKKTVIDQLVYFGTLAGMKAKNAKASALTLLERLEMQEYTNKKLMTLSKGNQQKIQFAATLIADPDLVVLDEPFSGLDPVNAMLLKDLVRELAQKNKIVLFSSHQMNYIEEFCNNIAILNGGGITLSGGIREIKRRADRSKIVISAQTAVLLAAALQQEALPFVRGVEAADETVTVQLAQAEDKGALLTKLAALGMDFDSFAVYEPTLSDIFVAYTKEAVQ